MPGYEADQARLAALDAQVLGVSVDSTPTHEAWAKSLGGLSYPLLSDFYPHGEVASRYGVFRGEEPPRPGVCDRAVFVIDKQGVIRGKWVSPVLSEIPPSEEIFACLERLRH
jgi:peroxiredoxin